MAETCDEVKPEITPEVRKLILSRYWQLMREEDIPNTPEITGELDHIESILLKCQSDQKLKDGLIQ